MQVPNPTLPSPNAYDFYCRATTLYVPPTTPVDATVDTISTIDAQLLRPWQMRLYYPTAPKEAWLRRNAPALRMLRQGFHYRYLHPPSRSLRDQLSQVMGFRTLARLLEVEVHAAVERGHYAQAAHSSLDIMRLGIDSPHGAPVRGALSGQQIQKYARKEIWSFLDKMDAVTARATAQKLELMEQRQLPLAKILEEEKWSMQGGLLEAMHGNFFDEVFEDEDARQRWRRLLFQNNRVILDNYTELMDVQIANARQPFQAPRQTIPEPRSALQDPFNTMTSNVFERIRIQSFHNHTLNLLLIVSLALRAYRLEHGAYPVNLQALVPRYLSKVPDDPFALSGPLQYNMRSTRYIAMPLPEPPLYWPGITMLGPEVSFDLSPQLGLPGSPPSNPSERYRYAETPYTLYSVGVDGIDQHGKPVEDNSESFNMKRHYQLGWTAAHNDIVAGINQQY